MARTADAPGDHRLRRLLVPDEADVIASSSAGPRLARRAGLSDITGDALGRAGPTSRIVVVQTRFAQTTNNWSKVASTASAGKGRTPHYYPESEVDRLSTNLVSVYLRALPASTRFMLAYRLTRSFFSQSARYFDPARHDLLRENYSDETVQTYLNHIRAARLGHPIGRMLWSHQQMLTLPARFRRTLKHWRALGAS